MRLLFACAIPRLLFGQTDGSPTDQYRSPTTDECNLLTDEERRTLTCYDQVLGYFVSCCSSPPAAATVGAASAHF